MFIGDKKSDFFFSHLSQYRVEDKNGKIIGRPGDALFLLKDLSIDSLILFGGLLEEKLEDLHLKENIDPIVPVSVIKTVDQKKKKITLNVGREELSATDDNYKAPAGKIQYLKLKKLPIFEKENERIGRVIDIHYRTDGKYSFIVGGSALEEFLEKIRVIPDKDLIVPSTSITEISDKIAIKLSKIDLITTLEDPNLNPEDILKSNKVGFVSKDVNYIAATRIGYGSQK